VAKRAAPPVVKSRILPREEYPAELLTGSPGSYPPDVRFVAVHPLGTYHVEHHGAGHHAAYFTPKRRGSRAKNVGGANSLRGALVRISHHEDELVSPDAPRERGQNGPVSIYSLGQRTAGKKTPTDLDREIEEFLRSHPE